MNRDESMESRVVSAGDRVTVTTGELTTTFRRNDNRAAAAQVASLHEVILQNKERAEAAIETLRAYADGTQRLWDDGQDSKVGKRLLAMSGKLPSYSPCLNEALSYAKGASVLGTEDEQGEFND